jgi:uncharacterized membrane protein YfcA
VSGRNKHRKLFEPKTTIHWVMDALLLLTLGVVGLASGLVMSLVGASAVMVIVPGLNVLLGYGIHTAIGVSLLVDVIASIAVGYAYWRNGNVDLSQGIWIALGSAVGAQLGAKYTVSIPAGIMEFGYGLWMVSAGVIIWKKGLDRTAIVGRFSKYVQLDSSAKRIAIALALGFAIGVNCGLFGAGGGILIMMVLIFVLDYPIHKAVGTSTVIMAITAASATTGYFMQGNVDVYASSVIVAGTVAGGLGGARFANDASEEILSKIVGVIFVALGVLMTVLRLL